ncbi:MAG: transglycosylase domain-containing protein [bacterium]|nr:transglycosylase domain-containing protein [bacterium]
MAWHQVRHVLGRVMMVTACVVLGVCGIGIGASAVLVHQAVRELPELPTVQAASLVQDVVFTDRDGTFVTSRRAATGDANRIVVPFASFPQHLTDAVVASEDARFWEHHGIDPIGIARAMVRVILHGDRQGGSTIPQQLLKLTTLGGRLPLIRKVQELLLVQQFDEQQGKAALLELYLNAVYLGHGNAGVEAAARDLFGVGAADLSVAESALLVGMIPAPSATSPFCNADLARAAQHRVLQRMVVTNALTASEADAVQRTSIRMRLADDREDPVVVASAVDGALAIMEHAPGDRVALTVDLPLQRAATFALADRLERYAQRRGEYAGPWFSIPGMEIERWREALKALRATVRSWHPQDPLVYDLRWLREGDGPDGLCRFGGSILRRALPNERASGIIFAREAYGALVDLGDIVGVLVPGAVAWTKQPLDAVAPIGAVVEVQLPEHFAVHGGEVLVQLVPRPLVEGAVLAVDPRDGAIRAAVGGYAFAHGAFNHVVRARRPIGSAVKPFIYAAALAAGTFNPLAPVRDVPVSYVDPWSATLWKPGNWYAGYKGEMLAVEALARSVNTVAVQTIFSTGVTATARFMEALHPVQQIPHAPGIALGAVEWTPLVLAGAYLPFARGGSTVPVRWVEQVQRGGQTFVRPSAPAQPLLDAWFAGTMDWMLRQTVQDPAGTGHALDALGLSIRAKTGTTNDAHDAWTVAYTPELLVVAWVGYDHPQSLRSRAGDESSVTLALPIVRDVFAAARARSMLQDTKEPTLDTPTPKEFAAVDAPRSFRDVFKEDE